jgi:hypothetical protein
MLDLDQDWAKRLDSNVNLTSQNVQLSPFHFRPESQPPLGVVYRLLAVESGLAFLLSGAKPMNETVYVDRNRFSEVAHPVLGKKHQASQWIM